MIIEFFGLSNTGKSVLKRELEKKGHKTGKYERTPNMKKLGNFLKYFVKHPGKTTYLFWKLNSNDIGRRVGPIRRLKIWKMRNSYLMSALGKAEHYSNRGKVFLDEFGLQSLFMVLHKKGTEREIRKLIKVLPLGENIFVFRGNDKLRKAAYKKKHPVREGTLLPGSGIDMDFAKDWMKTMEHNFKIVEKIIKKNYLESKGFDRLKGRNTKAYVRKDD